MWNYNHTDELSHHGILGMKWGVRRYQNRDGSLTPAGRKRRSLGEVISDNKKAKQQKKTLEKARATKAANKKAAEERAKLISEGKLSPKKMTNDELKAATERLKAEQEYNKLIKDVRVSPKTKKGEEIVTHIIENSAKNIGTQLVTKIAGNTVNKVAEALTGEKDFINPNKGQKDK